MTDPNPIRRRRVVATDWLWGWCQIADAIGVCERSAMRYAMRPSGRNPLPVRRIGGRVVAKPMDMDEWLERETVVA